MFKYEEDGVNKTLTSEEGILAKCRDLIAEKGLAAFNVRELAKRCGVQAGALYYYFPSKNDLLIAAIQSVWEDIFRLEDMKKENRSFPAYVEDLFHHIQEGIRRYPNFFSLHSLSFSEGGEKQARVFMDRYLTNIREEMEVALKKDDKVREGAFSDDFTPSDFVDLILLTLISLLLIHKKSVKPLLGLVRRSLYEPCSG